MLLGLLGFAIICLTLLDIFATTIKISSGGGPLTSKVSSWLWSAMLRYHKKRTSHRYLRATGLAIVLTPFVLWIVLIWSGWTLLFCADPYAVVEAESGAPADVWTRIYFTGFTLSTLGMGDYKPQDGAWQFVTAIASFNGFLLVSLAIAYLIPIVAAATQERHLASYISCFGKKADEIVLNAWNGKDFGLLGSHLVNLAPMLTLHAQSYLAYPVLRYFHSDRRSTAMPPSIAALDEALTLLEYGVKPNYRPDAVALSVARQAIGQLLETHESAFLKPASQAPSMPTLDWLRANGVPTVSDTAFHSAVLDLNKRRRLLLALVEDDGWFWDCIYSRNLMEAQPGFSATSAKLE